jgi:hypothetical protein
MSGARDDAFEADRGIGSFGRVRALQVGLGLGVPPARRLAWLEEVLAIAWRSGALDRARRKRAATQNTTI